MNIMRCILLVGLLTLLAVQSTSAIDLRYHWASSILILGAVSLVVWQLKPQLQRAMLALVVLLLMLILLISTWQSGVSTWNFIAGVLPTSDAGGYYYDAQRILAGNSISDFSSRRPLFAAFFAGALAVSGNDLQIALIFISIFQGVALAICLGLFPRAIPRIVVVVFVITIFLYYRRFVGTALTEQLGLAYGMIAFGLLLRGYCSENKWLIAGGIFVLSLGLNARAGPFLILLMLVLLAARGDSARAGVVSWRALFELSVVVALGFFLNQLLLILLQGDRTASFSNFSHTFYGLVFGGDWTLAFKQHPELALLSAKEQPTAIMGLALQHLIDHPSSLVAGAIKAWMVFIPTVYVFAASSHPFAPALVPYFVLSILALAGVAWVLQNLRRPLAQMLLFAFAGILLSVPFVPPWDSDQMRAYAAVLPFIAFLPSVGAMSLWGEPSVDLEEIPLSDGAADVKWWCFAGLILIGMASAVLPAWAHGQFPSNKFSGKKPQCDVGATVINAEILPGTLRKIRNDKIPIDLKSVGKHFLLDPIGGLSDVPKLFMYGSLTKEILEQNALVEFAPEYVRNFIHGVPENDYLAYARLSNSKGEISAIKLVFISDDVEKDTHHNFFCANELPKLDALRIHTAKVLQ